MNIPAAHTFFGFMGHFLLFFSAVFLVFGLRRRSPLIRVAVAAACLAFMFVVFDGVNVAGYMRGLLGDLSITTAGLLACSIVGHMMNRDILSEDDRRCVLMVVAISGLFLYPLTLGLMWVDPYRLGYNSFSLIYLILILVALCIMGYRSRRDATLFIPAGMIAFTWGFLESTNLWDYLIDPLVTVYAWAWIMMGIRRRKFA